MTARAFCRELELVAWARHQNDHKGLAPSNAALWRERVTRAEPREAEASGAPAHARTLRSRNQWTACWPRRWSVRRGFFKAGERLPLETRRATARFFHVPTNGKKRGPENGPQSRPPSEQHAWGVFKKWTPFFKTPVHFFPRSVLNSVRVQATAAWQWQNFWAARAPAGRTVVHINMDEAHGRRKGHHAHFDESAAGEKLQDNGAYTAHAHHVEKLSYRPCSG